MEGVSLSVLGVDDVMANMSTAFNGVSMFATQAIQAAGRYCEQQARSYCPVSKNPPPGHEAGTLQASITYQDDGSGGWICGTDVSYAWYVELGTVHMDAQPYLWPALQESQQMLEESLALKIS